MKKIAVILWNWMEKLVNIVLVKLFKIQFSDESWENLMQFIKFGLVGLSNTALGYVIYAVSLALMRGVHIGAKYDYLIAQFVMFVLTVLWSFYWNNKAVFKQQQGEKRNILQALIKTYISYMFTTLFLAEFLLFLWVDILGINEYIAPIISMLVTVPLNFVIQKFWAFRK